MEKREMIKSDVIYCLKESNKLVRCEDCKLYNPEEEFCSDFGFYYAKETALDEAVKLIENSVNINDVINILEDLLNEAENKEQQKVLVKAIKMVCKINSKDKPKKYKEEEQISLFDYL